MKRFTDSGVLLDGLSICLDRMTKMENESAIRKYLSFGSEDDESTVKEEVARLLLLATTKPSSESPVVGISKKIMDEHIVDIDSMFLKEFLEMRERNKKSSFVKSDFYKIISTKVDEMELKNSIDSGFYLNDGIFLVKGIRDLYVAYIDKRVNDDKLDVRYREPLVELFQYNLDCTLERLKNGVKSNVQVQTRHQ